MTDKQKKKIIADYLECENYAAVGRKHSISANYVKKIVKADPESADMFTQKKEENTLDVLSYLDGKAESLKRLGDYIMDDRLNPATKKEQLDEIPMPALVTAFGILTDKMLKSKEISHKTKTESNMVQINTNIQTLADILLHPAPDRGLPDDE